MGATLSWLAVKGKPSSAVLAELGLRATGEQGIDGDSELVAATSDDGWYLVVANETGHRIIDPAVVASLSRGCEALTCTVEEHVMFSQATGWRDGRRLWCVSHEGENGPVGIDEEGTLPPEYAAIRDRLVAGQEAEGGASADVDLLFDIPVALGQAFVGYKHDELNPAFEARGFEELEETRAKTSWIGRVFGG